MTSLTTQDFSVLAMDAYYHNNDQGDQTPPFDKISINVDYPADADFAATAYKTGDNQITIAYRGTDNLNPFGGDVWDGYGIAVGLTESQQQLVNAILFYQAVKKAHPNDEIILTGHSLGGALAGLVGSLYDEQAFVFDHEPYQFAATNAYVLATRGYLVGLDPDGNEVFEGEAGVFNSNQIQERMS